MVTEGMAEMEGMEGMVETEGEMESKGRGGGATPTRNNWVQICDLFLWLRMISLIRILETWKVIPEIYALHFQIIYIWERLKQRSIF